jgi:hypothetical protein
VLALLNEPTAAAFAYGLNSMVGKSRVLVFDLGGGTFDVTLVDMGNREINVIATRGDHLLGGKDWDDALIDHVAQLFIDRHGVDPRTNLVSLHDLRAKCVSAKISLSRKPKVNIFHDYAGKVLRVTIEREEFGVRALFDDPSIGQDEDPVGHRDCGEAVRDQDRRPSGGKGGKVLEQFVLGSGVNARRRLVENQDRRTPGKSPSDGDSLPHSPRGLVVAELSSEDGVEPLGHLLDGAREAGSVGSILRLRPRVGKTGPIAVGDVLRDGGGVAAVLLKHKGNAAAQILLVHGADIAPRHEDPPRGRLVEASEQLDERRFAGAVLADDRHRLPGRDLERQIMKRVGCRAGISEADALAADVGVERLGEALATG